jgi:hypothetical protein
MRKTLIFTLVLCLVAVFAYAQGGTGAGSGAGSGAAAGSGSTASSGTTTTTTTTTAPAKGGKHHGGGAKAKTYRGTVASVDQAGKSFVVHPAKGADVTLKVNDKTKYSPKGKGWDDVKADAKVSGAYKNDGTDNWATTVHFAAEKKPAAAKTTSK